MDGKSDKKRQEVDKPELTDEELAEIFGQYEREVAEIVAQGYTPQSTWTETEVRYGCTVTPGKYAHLFTNKNQPTAPRELTAKEIAQCESITRAMQEDAAERDRRLAERAKAKEAEEKE